MLDQSARIGLGGALRRGDGQRRRFRAAAGHRLRVGTEHRDGPFRKEHGAVVMKPLHGHGGAAVFRVMPQDMNFGSLFDMFSVTFREPWVIQRFLPEVKHGDKRIILVDGEFAGAVNRVPAPDDLRSNMVRGGAAQATELSPREREICDTLAPALRERGLLFVGIDVIDGNLTEINVTSPTGIRAIARLGGPDVAARIWDTIEAKRGGK